MKKNNKKYIIIAVIVILFVVSYYMYTNSKLYLVPKVIIATGLDDTPENREALNKKTVKELKELIKQ
ncbi:MAG: hypothetical protein WCT85_00615 [Parachlamydiales bacterium]|jgi:hypothetical protein